MRADAKGRSGVTQSTKRGTLTVRGGITAFLMLALLAGFSSVPDAVAATESATRFSSSLSAAARRSVKVNAAESTSVSSIVVARRKNSTTLRAAATRAPRIAAVTAASSGASGELARAQSILAGYKAKYPILAGATISFGDARGHQAICYYKSGRIVVSPSHTASLERIIGHEIWHIIDWRDNGRIDWGENVPPR